jgi:SPP1 gp7 family putative phage head morphogenesis protein
MSRALRQEIREAPTGQLMQQLLREQVELIKSLPIEAAQRVHQLTMELVSSGGRAAEIVPMILASGDVTISRANTIARTEVGRTATGLTQARAVFVGSEGYQWLTARDRDVRASHRKMEGKFVRWDDPPTLDGLTGHAGALPNCRCTPLPVVPDTFD